MVRERYVLQQISIQGRLAVVGVSDSTVNKRSEPDEAGAATKITC